MDIRCLTSAVDDVELAGLPLAAHAPEPLELLAAQRVQPLVPRRVLHEARLVAEPVVAVLPHAVEVRLTGQSQWFCELHFSLCCHGQIGMGGHL